MAWVGRDVKDEDVLTGLCCSLADCNDCKLEKVPGAGKAALARAGL